MSADTRFLFKFDAKSNYRNYFASKRGILIFLSAFFELNSQKRLYERKAFNFAMLIKRKLEKYLPIINY